MLQFLHEEFLKVLFLYVRTVILVKELRNCVKHFSLLLVTDSFSSEESRTRSSTLNQCLEAGKLKVYHLVQNLYWRGGEVLSWFPEAPGH